MDDFKTQAALLAEKVPGLRYDLDKGTEEQFDDLMPTAHVAAFSEALGIEGTEGRDLLIEATEAYIGGLWDRFGQ